MHRATSIPVTSLASASVVGNPKVGFSLKGHRTGSVWPRWRGRQRHCAFPWLPEGGANSGALAQVLFPPQLFLAMGLWVRLRAWPEANPETQAVAGEGLPEKSVERDGLGFVNAQCSYECEDEKRANPGEENGKG